ncbi:NAD(P)-binding protein [Testicularia cyperi]|uniref:UDP-glucuronic acid decarboxylase 1 n=1 Tax=Testicularia cyperi TaxID=1882483 RepID=A0A317XMM9_9BASI|nr:NAD(P)-binding protein [Testicularia cyperi]
MWAPSTASDDIANDHADPPEHQVPIEHLRSLYFRPALGSGVLVPSPSSGSLRSSSQASSSSAPRIGTSASSAISNDAGSSQPVRHVRTDSNSMRTSRPAASTFWAQHNANAHPDSHVSIHARAQAGSPSLHYDPLGRRGSANSITPPQQSMSYIHTTHGSAISSAVLGVDHQLRGLGIGRDAVSSSSSAQSSSFYGYLPTRVLPVEDKKRILITGGAGFVGSHLVDRLMLMGHEVLVLDNFFTGQKSNVSQWSGHPNFEIIRHDVVNPLVIEVDQIYHLACPASPISYQANQVKTIKTNFMGTLNTLGLAKRTKARFLLASTSEVYGDPDVHPQPETYNGNVNPTGPRACYDEGKRVAETLTYGYFYQDGVDVRVARIFNTYGPRMHPRDGRVVSNFILQALKGEPLTVFGDGSQTRSFMYIHDLIDGLISLMNVERPEQDPYLVDYEEPAPLPAALPLETKIMVEATDSILPSEAPGTAIATSTVQTDRNASRAADESTKAAAEDTAHRHRSDVHSPVNLGNPAEFTINELVEVVQRCVHEYREQTVQVSHAKGGTPVETEPVEIRHLPMPKDDPKQRKPDITRATHLLDWYPRWKLEDGLREMTRWYAQRLSQGSL